jgi:hypothetical protein
MLAYLKGLFGQPSALDHANEELKRARLQELEEQSMAEYTAAKAKCHEIMAGFERGRITRLVAYTTNQNKE